MKFELECFRRDFHTVTQLVPASRDCALFDENPHAVKCLPLSIANTIGWEVLCPDGVTIEWDGRPGADGLRVTFDEPERWASSKDDRTRPQPFAKSHFATGVVTFDVGWLFKTPPGWSLLAMGKPNDYRDGIYPLMGAIETTWLDYQFTMNWKLTRPGKVRFEKGDAFCFITPTRIRDIAECQPVERNLADHPELLANISAGGAERDRFLARQRAGDPETIKHPWQRRYWLGQQPEGSTAPAPEDHIVKVRTKAPIAAERPPSHLPVFDHEGRFTPSPRTRTVRCAADAADLDFLVVDHALSSAECAALRGLYDRHPDLYEQGHKDTNWNNRLLGLHGLHQVDPAGAELMRRSGLDALRKIAAFYRVKAPLYADVVHLTRWSEGRHMPIHADNANRDGSTHSMPHRAYSGLFYLSDEFEGGGLYLPHQDVLIQPHAGMFVSLPGGLTHEHGVVRVKRGDRYTMPLFATHNRAKAERTIHPEVARGPFSFATGSAASFGAVNLAVATAKAD